MTEINLNPIFDKSDVETVYNFQVYNSTAMEWVDSGCGNFPDKKSAEIAANAVLEFCQVTVSKHIRYPLNRFNEVRLKVIYLAPKGSISIASENIGNLSLVAESKEGGLSLVGEHQKDTPKAGLTWSARLQHLLRGILFGYLLCELTYQLIQMVR